MLTHRYLEVAGLLVVTMLKTVDVSGVADVTLGSNTTATPQGTLRQPGFERLLMDKRAFRKSGSGNTMLTSDFRPEVEIRPFRACAIINTQYNPYLWPSCPNFRVL